MDPIGGGGPDRAQIRHPARFDGGGGTARQTQLDATKAIAAAYQRDPEAIEKWRRETYPAIARQAKADGAEVFFWDESGFRADAVHGRTWGVKGKTPVVERPGQRQSISAA